MSKMKEKELLGRLERIVKAARDHLRYWTKKDEQAHHQIKEMIKGRAEQEEIEARYIEIILDLYERISDLCKQLKAKKRVMKSNKKDTKYCCQAFKQAIKRKLVLSELYPSGKEYYKANDKRGGYLSECPFCNEYFF